MPTVKKRNDELFETINDLKIAQENEITDAINGTSDVLNDGVDKSSDISTKLNTLYSLNVKNTNWKNEVESENMIEKTSNAVDTALESKAKSLNRVFNLVLMSRGLSAPSLRASRYCSFASFISLLNDPQIIIIK